MRKDEDDAPKANQPFQCIRRLKTLKRPIIDPSTYYCAVVWYGFDVHAGLRRAWYICVRIYELLVIVLQIQFVSCSRRTQKNKFHFETTILWRDTRSFRHLHRDSKSHIENWPMKTAWYSCRNRSPKRSRDNIATMMLFPFSSLDLHREGELVESAWPTIRSYCEESSGEMDSTNSLCSLRNRGFHLDIGS